MPAGKRWAHHANGQPGNAEYSGCQSNLSGGRKQKGKTGPDLFVIRDAWRDYTARRRQIRIIYPAGAAVQPQAQEAGTARKTLIY